MSGVESYPARIRRDVAPPAISVITPSFNYDAYISDCLSSVQHQSGASFEHLVVDDGSTDASVAVIRGHSASVPLVSQPNVGLSRTLNRLLDLATGEWIGWLNADDFYLEGALDKVAAVASSEPKCELIIGDTVWVDAQGKSLRLLASHGLSSAIVNHYGMFVAPSSFFVRRTLLQEIRFNEDTRFLMDKWLFAELARRGVKVARVSEPLSAMRRHTHQVSQLERDARGDDERRAFRTAHHLPTHGVGLRLSKATGLVLHNLAKLSTGGMWREWRFRSLVGRDSRWWANANYPNEADH